MWHWRSFVQTSSVSLKAFIDILAFSNIQFLKMPLKLHWVHWLDIQLTLRSEQSVVEMVHFISLLHREHINEESLAMQNSSFLAGNCRIFIQLFEFCFKLFAICCSTTFSVLIKVYLVQFEKFGKVCTFTQSL